MLSIRPTLPGDDRHGTPLELALGGAMFGCVAVGIVSGLMGIWPLFFAYLPFTVHLALSAALGAALTTILERHCARSLSASAVMAIAGALTFLIFTALPLYLFFHRSIWPARLLFG